MPNATVESLVKKEYVVTPDEDYYICRTSDCSVIFYSNTKEYLADQVSVPVWYKTYSKEKILCYCSHVTQNDIRRAVTKMQTKNVKQIIKETGAMQNCDCIHKNPTGKCCLSEITNFIDTL